MDELKNAILLKKYKIIKRIGKGAFGSVFVGKNINKIDYVAIKLELKNQTDTILEREAYILHMLRGFGIPRVISYGHNLKYNILIQELLGKSLDKLLFKKNKKLSLKDSCMVGIQILDRLEYIHNKSIIHRDIKADNFLIGLKNTEVIYIIDFGLAKQYRSTKTGKHVKYCVNKKWSGTSRFASANTLRGIEPSRRDDMESFCYLLLYLMKGTLPWDKLNETSEINEILIIYKMKQYMPADVMFKELPSQMSDFYKYCKNLGFEQKPNYKYLRKLLISILEYIGEKNDLYFSWIIQNSLKKDNKVDIPKTKQRIKNNDDFYKYKKIINKPTNTSKKNQRKIKLNDNRLKNYIQLRYINSSKKKDKENENNLELKKHILGYCNIIKRKYIKSQSPNIKRVITENEKIKKKIDPKKNVIIDLTDFIENKKANEIKSYKTKLLNYKENKKHKMIKTENQSKNKCYRISPNTERKIAKNSRININKNCINNPILKVSTYSINGLSSIKIKNDKINNNIEKEFYLEKETKTKIRPKENEKLNSFEIANKENNQKINGKYLHSNSITNINNYKYQNYNELNFLFPKIKRSIFNYSDYKFKNRSENGSIIYNKKILKTNSGFIPKIKTNSRIIKHKMTDNGITYNNYKRIKNI